VGRPCENFVPEWRELAGNAIYKCGNSSLTRQGDTKKTNGRTDMARILKALFILALLAFAGLVGYAYLGDLTPERSDIRQPVELNVGQ
jgi:hypothetical protein